MNFGKTRSISEARRLKNLPSTEFEDDIEMMKSTRRVCEENKDILERFFRENYEVYWDISNKLSNLKAHAGFSRRIR